MRRTVIALAALALASGVGACGAGEVEDDAQQGRLDDIRKATDEYKELLTAQRQGFRPLPGCAESSDGDGARGIAYVHLERIRDEKVDLLKPEMLFYEPQDAGRKHELVGVGYYVPDDGQAPPDTPLGHFDGPIPGGFKGFDDHYELHAWVHRENPDGPVAVWNPEVKCT
jgi:hypothetical protein